MFGKVFCRWGEKRGLFFLVKWFPSWSSSSYRRWSGKSNNHFSGLSLQLLLRNSDTNGEEWPQLRQVRSHYPTGKIKPSCLHKYLRNTVYNWPPPTEQTVRNGLLSIRFQINVFWFNMIGKLKNKNEKMVMNTSRPALSPFQLFWTCFRVRLSLRTRQI